MCFMAKVCEATAEGRRRLTLRARLLPFAHNARCRGIVFLPSLLQLFLARAAVAARPHLVQTMMMNLRERLGRLRI